MPEKPLHPTFVIGRTLEVNLNHAELSVVMIDLIREQMGESGIDTVVFKNAEPSMFRQFLKYAQVGQALELGKYECIEKKAPSPVGTPPLATAVR